MDKPELTQSRIIGAFVIAIIADLIQFPITAVEATGLFTIPGELADFVVDCFVMGATTVLLGFHWMLLPSLLVEVVPGLDLIPTWTGCVAFVVWQRKKQQAQPPPLRSAVDVQEMETIRVSPPLPVAPVLLPPKLPALQIEAGTPVEQRLTDLKKLLEKELISPTEYETKRREILGEL
jgi:hypothetical protein